MSGTQRAKRSLLPKAVVREDGHICRVALRIALVTAAVGGGLLLTRHSVSAQIAMYSASTTQQENMNIVKVEAPEWDREQGDEYPIEDIAF